MLSVSRTNFCLFNVSQTVISITLSLQLVNSLTLKDLTSFNKYVKILNMKQTMISAPVSEEFKAEVIKEIERLGINQADFARMAMKLLLRMNIPEVLRVEALKIVMEEKA